MSNDLRERSLEIPKGVMWRILSAPIFLKVIGIGAVVAVIFGSVTLFVTKRGTDNFRRQMVGLRLAPTTQELARKLESTMVDADSDSVQRLIEQTLQENPDIRCITVHDANNSKVAQAVTAGTSSKSSELSANGPAPDHAADHAREVGTLFVSTEELLGGELGTLHIAATDSVFQAQMLALNRRMVVGLLFSIGLGISLAFLLTHLLTYL